MPILWNDPEFHEAVSELANALQVSLTLSATVRRNAQQHADEAVRLEAQIDRAARAVKRLRDGGTR